MKLFTPESEYEVKPLAFPGGEIIPLVPTDLDITSVYGHPDLLIYHPIINPASLFFLEQVKWVLDSTGDNLSVALLAPFIFGARQDRVMEFGQPLTAKLVADWINRLNFAWVQTYAAHSDVLTACLDRYQHIAGGFAFQLRTILDPAENVALVSPDSGATKRGLETTKQLQKEGFAVEHFQGYKVRDTETGELSGFACDDIPGAADRVVVIDDICCNGGTFLGLHKQIKRQVACPIDLVVAHADHGKGITEMATAFDEVFVTNSRPLSTHPGHGVTVMDWLDLKNLHGEVMSSQ